MNNLEALDKEEQEFFDRYLKPISKHFEFKEDAEKSNDRIQFLDEDGKMKTFKLKNRDK